MDNSPWGHVRINGNELIDLFPTLWTTRLERAVNKINGLSDEEVPEGVAHAS